MSLNESTVKHILQNHPHPWVKLAFCDFDGIIRGKLVSKEIFLSAVEENLPLKICPMIFGLDCADTDYEWDSLEVGPSKEDLYLQADLKSLRFLPWEKNLPLLLCNILNAQKEPHPLCPRTHVENIEKKYNQQGRLLKCAFELEFIIGNADNFLKTPLSRGYGVTNFQQYAGFYQDLIDFLPRLHLNIQSMHQEFGPGMWEIALAPQTLLVAADQCVVLKLILKELAFKNHHRVSFMAKWDESSPGLGNHFHLSLWEDKKNIFFHQSESMNYFLSGLSQLSSELIVFFAPFINSYRRYTPGEFAPIKFDWKKDDRSVAFRLLGSTNSDVRIENRLAGADANPYWVAYATALAGLFGLEQRLPLPQSASERQEIPPSLYQASLALKHSVLAKELLPAKTWEHMLNTRLWEWEQFKETFAENHIHN